MKQAIIVQEALVEVPVLLEHFNPILAWMIGQTVSHARKGRTEINLVVLTKRMRAHYATQAGVRTKQALRM